MHRVDTPGNADNLFSDGNPATGQQATQLLAAWFNDVQESLCHLVEEAGIELEKGDYTQVTAAVLALIAGVVGDGSGAVPTTRLVSTAGLATGGGALAVDRTITVPKASGAEVATGTDDTKAITPLALAGGIGAKLLAGVGYVRRLEGTIEMWGTFTVGANSSVTVTLPDTFPTMCVHAECAGGRNDYSAQDNNPFVSGRSATSITIFNSADTSVSGTFFAIGY